MTCKDCLHYQVCMFVADMSDEEREAENVENDCSQFFKDRSKWVEQKHGRWITKDGDIHCSHCNATRGTMKGYELMVCIDGKWVSSEKTNYCPNCGAKMDGDGMANCKACNAWFSSTIPHELCPTCERALKRLDGYAVPVVRCKDCIFASLNTSNGTFKCTTYNGMHRTVEAWEYCFYGERKDND